MASKKNKRAMERRVFNLTSCEVREAADGTAHFTGYAAVFGELSVNLGGFRERIAPGCFRNAVEEGQDVRFLINHDANLILGRTPRTLALAEDETGLRVDCDLPDTSYARDLAVSMERGDITGMSFGFVTREDAWKVKDAETGLPIRELVEADLFDVSVVAYPAYPDTTAEIRSLIESETPELLVRAELASNELPEAVAELTDEELEQRAQEGLRIEEGHPQCQGIAVVWNWNGEMESCHADRAAAEAHMNAMLEAASTEANLNLENDDPLEPGTREEETVETAETEVVEETAAETVEETVEETRAGKVLAQKHQDSLNDAHDMMERAKECVRAVLDACNEGGAMPEEPAEGTGTVMHAELPHLAEIRSHVEERGWDWDDDFSLYLFSEMLELASLFLLLTEDDEDEAGMKPLMAEILQRLGGAVAALTTDAGNGDAEEREAEAEAEEREDEGETEEREDEPVVRSSVERERRRLELLERELEVL